jgi:hypothetical protein
MRISDRNLSDADIRSALRSRLRNKYRGDSDTILLEELGFCRGQARIDVAVVNGLLHGYEIKSERDSLRRLGAQLDFYSRVLDRATLVVSERHLDKAIEMIPEWWGVLRVEVGSRGPRFRTLRRESKNPGRDPRSLVELIWLDDALALLEKRGIARGFRGKPRRMVWDRICEYFKLDEIAEAVRNHLKARAAHQALPRLL